MESVRVIIEAVNNNNTDLALRTVSNELQRNPSSDVYLALKVFAASRANDRSLAVETAKDAVKVCSKKTSELFLIPVLASYNESELLQAVFVRTNRINPQDKDITEGWVEVMLLLGNLSGAQKALMAQQKQSAKPRLTCFQVCLVMALDKPNPVFPMLAERMLEKHLPVKSAQECYVVALVRKMSSQDKMVEYLQSAANKTFVESSLDIQQLLLNALIELKKWTELFEYAKGQLSRIDSYNYWEALNSSASALGIVDEAVAFNAKFNGNNAKLAQVDLATKCGNQSVEAAVAGYWETMSSKPSTFDYLKPYITTEIIEALPETKDLGSLINLVKLKSLVGHQTALSNDKLFELYVQHKSEIPKTITDYFTGTDALLLAATRILKEESLSDFSREKAATILEHAVTNDPHQFYARVLLIQIYRSLGAYELATKHFDTLAIRNVQLETLGHLLSTRAGSVDPKLTFKVFDKLFLARNRVPNMGTYAVAALNESAFTQFRGIFELGKQLRFSLGYALLILEKTKSSRVGRGSVDMSEVVQIPEPASALLDSRDFKTAFDTEASKVCSVGPIQGTEFVRIQKSKEIAYLSALKSGQKGGYDLSFVTEAANSDELTPMEKWNVQVLSNILTGETLPSPPPVTDSNEFTDWTVLHWCYTILETVKVCKDLKASPPSAWLEAVRETCTQHNKKLDEYESSAIEAVSSAIPFEHSKVVTNIRKALAAALSRVTEEIGSRRK